MNKYEMTTEIKKNTIISAALKLFSKHGFTKVSIKSIANAANVSQVSIYNYFGSKEALVDECANIILEDTLNKANEILNSNADFKVKLSKALKLCTNEMNRSISNHLSSEALKDSTMVQLLVESFNKKKELIYKEYIELGIKEGVIAKTISTDILLIYMNALNSIGHKEKVFEMNEKQIEQIHQLFLYGIMGK